MIHSDCTEPVSTELRLAVPMSECSGGGASAEPCHQFSGRSMLSEGGGLSLCSTVALAVDSTAKRSAAAEGPP